MDRDGWGGGGGQCTPTPERNCLITAEPLKLLRRNFVTVIKNSLETFSIQNYTHF